MVAVRLDNISKVYGKSHAAREVDLHIGQGEFVTLLGASGSGKTTCLRMIGGFVPPSSGRILFDGEDITRVPAHRRNIGMVFQQYALFPHLTVAENIAFGLKVRRLPKPEVAARVREALRLVRLEAFGERYPAQLSGGQKQRVALARAVVINPKVLLLDEPLGALDLKLREELQAEIKRVQGELGITAIFVTHDQGEALTMSDRIAVMRDGRVAQVGTPDEIYSRPQSRYVANFVGRTNFLPVIVEGPGDQGLRVRGAVGTFTVAARFGADFAPGAEALLAFRPEDAHPALDSANRIIVRVEKVIFVGEGRLLHGRTETGDEVVARLSPGDAVPGVGAAVTLGISPARALLLRGEG
ncbi:ABC transporter ATP-binding protein [Zavarzinia compransoris]|uniref:Spermidine/putrescine import ATP-binding protein PotA n=1 Tax=Zavarzinia compransoris TaxID=1264899 RepID=A0A317DV15_9PROT|nr:ABC transporter ATP-binding protein [Zavarzinia compransoris]PWR17820.1 polyamine ABC transporter ATP-binding protein [Zavarzinia compransoris]TDP49353.1 putative spermidine/putrescine transport system ATP-binding protein [Zavarzinia compransoris]